MKIYLDNCSLQRPLDNKTQIRIAIEAEAILGILELVEQGEIQLISSEVLYYEISKTPRIERKQFAFAILSYATMLVSVTGEVESLAGKFEKAGITSIDALHLASAVASGVDYFCTCDDTFLKKAKSISGLSTKIMSPIELAQELEK